METNAQNIPTGCCCQTSQKPKPPSKSEIVKSTSLAVFIAFFPKCPLCWAAYMSLFSSIGLTQIPYMPWLLPVLMVMLAIHLFFLFKKVSEKGYLPVSISIVGALCIVISRYYVLENPTLSYLGLAAMVMGSFLNTRSFQNFKFQKN